MLCVASPASAEARTKLGRFGVTYFYTPPKKNEGAHSGGVTIYKVTGGKDRPYLTNSSSYGGAKVKPGEAGSEAQKEVERADGQRGWVHGGYLKESLKSF